MKILAFETSCDDTSVAIFENSKLLAMSTFSQLKAHEATSGVVPEVAAREHANNIFDAIDSVLTTLNSSLESIDYIAVTTRPGLIPSLLTGVTVASGLSLLLQKPILEIDHIEAHIFANFLERKSTDISFPLVCLTVSGGHSDIYFMKDMWGRGKIGLTQDDAAGEAYDKVAKMMGLGYPGGPIISEYAEKFFKKGSKLSHIFPLVTLGKDSLDFSFSGLKSAVKREVDIRREKGMLDEEAKEHIAAEFQEAINEVMARKLIMAAKKHNVETILLAGGVSANDNLRSKIEESLPNNMQFFSPLKKIYSMDNAAMVGILAYYKISSGQDTGKIGIVEI